MDADPANTRRFPRIQAGYPVLIKKMDPEEFAGLATTRVLSLGGCLVETEEALPKGTPVELRISVAGRILIARGIVANERPAGESRAEAGIEFLAVPLEDLELLQRITRPAPGEA
jgi:hypothetical protein